jgi:hypothetical protein
MDNYLLNLNVQLNGDYEVHKDSCRYRPVNNYDPLGYYSNCSYAVRDAKAKHPYKNINGCIHCCPDCHTQ